MQDIVSKLNQHQIQSIVIELRATQKGKPPASLGRAIHALVLKWLNIGDAQLAQEVHQADISPLVLSGLIGNRRQPKTLEGDRFLIRISMLKNNLIKPLLKGIERQENENILLANFPFILSNFYTIPDSHKLAKITDYYSLAIYSPTLENIKIQFLSPTSFKQKQRIQNFPLPELVFNSLQRKWNYFAPEELHFSSLDWNSLVSAYELKTYALRLEGGAEIGCQGWVKYCFTDKEQKRIASILSNFAFYAGVGRKTSMGMGQCQLLVENKKKNHD